MVDTSEFGPEVAAPQEVRPRTANEKQTAKRAIEILLARDEGFYLPSRVERNSLLVAFAMKQRVLYGAAFDLVRLTQPIDLTDPPSLSGRLSEITLYEIKSTNKPTTRPDFGGYFFDLTTAELLTAQSLGLQYKFAFVNTLTLSVVELTLNQVLAKARKVYPKWAVTF